MSNELKDVIWKYATITILIGVAYLIHNNYLENNFNKPEYSEDGKLFWVNELEAHYKQFAIENTNISNHHVNITTTSNTTSQFDTMTFNISPENWEMVEGELLNKTLTAFIVQFYTNTSVYCQLMTPEWKELILSTLADSELVSNVRFAQYLVNNRQAFVFTKHMLKRAIVHSFPTILLFYQSNTSSVEYTTFRQKRTVSNLTSFIRTSLYMIGNQTHDK